MRNRIKICLVVLSLATVFSEQAFACYPLWIGPGEQDICGLSLSLPFGGSDEVTGLEVGLASGTLRMNGIQANLLGNVSFFSDGGLPSGIGGMQLGGLINVVLTDMAGIQVAGLANFSSGMEGIQVAGIMNADDKGKSTGIQLGLFNAASHFTGLQIGLLNMSENLRGVQIGLINGIKSSPVRYLPIMNAYF